MYIQCSQLWIMIILSFILNFMKAYLDWKRSSGWLESWEGLLESWVFNVGVQRRTNNSPSQDSNHPDDLFQSRYGTPGFKLFSYLTSNNHRLESAGLNALEELLRCWECTEKIVKPACVFWNWMFLDILPEVVIAVLHVVEIYIWVAVE